MRFTEKDVNLVLVYDTLKEFMDAVLHRQKNAREVKLVAAEGTTGTKPTDQIKEEWCKGIGWFRFVQWYMHVWACLCTQSQHKRHPMMNIMKSA